MSSPVTWEQEQPLRHRAVGSMERIKLYLKHLKQGLAHSKLWASLKNLESAFVLAEEGGMGPESGVGGHATPSGPI